MNVKNITILLMLVLMAFRLEALEVSSTAGTLSNGIADEGITELTVTGTMNALDFYYIADHLHELKTLDLTDVEIVACSTSQHHYWHVDFASDELPVCAFGGLGLTSVKLPSGLKRIDEGAFAGCSSLVEVVMPSTLTAIGDYAFAGCSALTSVTLPASVEKVGAGAFMRCLSLTSFSVEPSSCLTTIEPTALMDCPALTTFLPGPVQTIGERALAGAGVSSVDLTASKHLTTIGDWAMVQSPVTEVKLPSNVTSVGTGAWMYDTALQSLTLGGQVTNLSDYILAGTGLKSPLNLTGVSEVGDYAFYNVSSLVNVELPATLSWLGTRAMAGMTGMKALTCHAVEVPALGEKVWEGVKQRSVPLTVPEESFEQYRLTQQWMDFMYETKGLLGDVNIDGEVNIADINTLISIVLGEQFSDEIMQRADVNEDGETGLADVNMVIDIILNPGSYAAHVVNVSDGLHIDDVSMRPGEQCELNVELDNASAYNALQCDIILPAGLTLVSVKAVQGQTIETRATDASMARTLMFSMDKQAFDGDCAAVLHMTVQADDAFIGDAQLLLTNVVLSGDDNVAKYAADCVAGVKVSSGIDDLTVSHDRLWTEGRTLCIESTTDGVAQVVSINGMARQVDVTAGVTRQVLEAGFYVVRLNGKSYKIVIK